MPGPRVPVFTARRAAEKRGTLTERAIINDLVFHLSPRTARRAGQLKATSAPNLPGRRTRSTGRSPPKRNVDSVREKKRKDAKKARKRR